MVIFAMILSAAYTMTLEPVPFGISQVGMHDVSRTLPESSSPNLDRPIGILIIAQIARAGKNLLHDTIVHEWLCSLTNLILAGDLISRSFRIFLLLYAYTRSRDITVRFIHKKDGAKGYNVGLFVLTIFVGWEMKIC